MNLRKHKRKYYPQTMVSMHSSTSSEAVATNFTGIADKLQLAGSAPKMAKPHMGAV